MTVRELLMRMDSHELSEWLAFSTLEPFGADAEYLGHAIVATTVANANNSDKNTTYEVKDFMPKFEVEIQSVDSMIQIAEMFTTSLGGQDLRKE